MQPDDPLADGLVHETHTHLVEASAYRLEVVDLEDHHVATVAAALVEQSAGGGSGLGRRHDLEQFVADREQRVAQPERGHSRVAVTQLDAELAPHPSLGGRQVGCNHDDLTKLASPRHAPAGESRQSTIALYTRLRN